MPRLVFALPCLLVSAAAGAQPAQLDEFHPAVDSRGYLSLNGSTVLGHEELSFGLGSLEWGHHMSGTVDNVVAATLVAAMGLRLGPVPLARENGPHGSGTCRFHARNLRGSDPLTTQGFVSRPRGGPTPSR